ncbi:hypothetical protein EG68_01429, partial [Paragonimus skrjabini miyazakii]
FHVSGRVYQIETDKASSQLKREEILNLLNYAINQSAIGDSIEKMVSIVYESPDQNGADVVDILLRINLKKRNSTLLVDQLGKMQARLSKLIYVTEEVKDLFPPTSDFKRPLWFSYPENRTPCIAVHGFIRFERKNFQAFGRTMEKLAMLEGALENKLLLVVKNSGKLGENFTSGNIFVDNMEHVDCKTCPAFVNFYFCKNALIRRQEKKKKMGRNTMNLFGRLQEEMENSFKKFTILDITWPVQEDQTRVRLGGVVYLANRPVVWDQTLTKKRSEKYRVLTHQLQKQIDDIQFTSKIDDQTTACKVAFYKPLEGEVYAYVDITFLRKTSSTLRDIVKNIIDQIGNRQLCENVCMKKVDITASIRKPYCLVPRWDSYIPSVNILLCAMELSCNLHL